MAQRLLAVYAHPDDESFGSGGTIATCAADGVEVTLVCATRGEVGEIADATLATPETLPQVRERELRSAADALGIGEVIFLGYRDSGMAGTDDNEDPNALIKASEEEVVSALVEIMRKKKPHVVLTFEPGGGYGHPDHMAISRHTLLAVQASGDGRRFPDRGEPWSVSRLFYAVFTRGRMTAMRDQLAAIGQDTSRFDRRLAEGHGWPDGETHVDMDVSAHVEAKWAALRSHRTQQGTFTLFSRLPEDVAKRLMSLEAFALALPEVAPETRFSGLFGGLP
ncbi:MAG: PIG-L family deacetylase [Chloroflexi bacterium]|nr:PIG-L family deacetylase [Chloroflexota bacterium]